MRSRKEEMGRPPKKRANPVVVYKSDKACPLAPNDLSWHHYSDLDFTVLTHERTDYHLNMLEAMFIHALKPV